jgi:predicted Ser/Thr protein kinase
MLVEHEKSEILRWIEQSLKTGENLIGRGSQGKIYLYREDDPQYVIKVASGWGLGRLVRWLMLRNEYRAYCRLAGVEGVPRCYGFLDSRYLVLEHIEGDPFRLATLTDRDWFFHALFNLIERMHSAGVAHGDLRNKKNILVRKGSDPTVIDFGIAVSLKRSGSMINNYLFRLLRQADYNSWIKLKYRVVKYAPDEDMLYFKWTVYDRLWRFKKRCKKWLRNRQRNRIGETAGSRGTGKTRGDSRVQSARLVPRLDSDNADS